MNEGNLIEIIRCCCCRNTDDNMLMVRLREGIFICANCVADCVKIVKAEKRRYPACYEQVATALWPYATAAESNVEPPKNAS